MINSMDDEYKSAGIEDPQLMVTTSRDPSAKLKQFAKVSDFHKSFIIATGVSIFWWTEL